MIASFGASVFLSLTLKSSDVSNLPKRIFFVISFLFLQILTLTVVPTFVLATIAG
jgi:hypothetical protein